MLIYQDFSDWSPKDRPSRPNENYLLILLAFQNICQVILWSK